MKHPWSPQHFRGEARKAGRPEGVIEAAVSAASAIKRTHPDLPVIFTLHHLAHLAEVSADDLQQVAFRKLDAYRVFRVKKRGVAGMIPAPPRRYRTICVPQPFLMQVQRWIAQNILNLIEPHPASFAFTPGRDLVGAAARHLGSRWLVKMDVRHFFESISEPQVYRVFRSLGYGALLSFQMARICTRLPSRLASLGRGKAGLPYRRHEPGHLPQGAPTSPMLANLTMDTLDRRLTTLAQSEGWTYTRYADDLAFSRTDGASRPTAMRLAKRVAHQLDLVGLTHHREKTSVVPPGARKVLLGVLVDGDRPRLTRAFRNNVETHLFALTSESIGPSAHRQKRGFASTIGMRRHIEGLIAFAHQVNPSYAAKLYVRLNTVDWSR
ncbi:reverse transcriptase family protein [Bradyrhizobium sp. SZCCHNR2012]|uniref:reverse transcriptase family protein n=1 Tax=Bradyrhizobium sp. SZCCHNR2012 TaxID=3057377 RepID=UPI0028F1624D|nr:reverse transcriptase family protein [Bradyrhizobium sp. SZCCHNR2012]